MFTIQYVKDLKWCNAEHTMFECVVKYAEFNEELPAGINATDPYDHIHEIWTNGIAGNYGLIAEYIPPGPPTAEENKQKAEQLLTATDWTAMESIADPAVSNPYLINQANFLAYRSAVREIAVNPIAGDIVWPVKPNEQWSS